MLNTDVIRVILTHVTRPNTYMNCLYVCSSFYLFLMKNHEDKIKSFNLGIVGLCRRYPLLPWNNIGVNNNKSVSLRDVVNYPLMFEYLLNTNIILKRLIEQGVITNNSSKKLLNTNLYEDLPLDFIKYVFDTCLFPQKTIYVSWITIISNKNVKFDTEFDIKFHKDDIPSKMTIVDIIKREEYKSSGSCDRITCNENININYVLDNSNNFSECDWNNLSCNKGISIDDMVNNPQLPWDYLHMLYHPSITMKDVISYYDRSVWNRTKQSTVCLNITFEEVMNHNEKLKWNNEFICGNVVITKNDLIVYNEFSWNQSLSRNPSVTEEIIDYGKEIGIKWNYKNLSKNSNITLKYVLDNIKEKWDWFNLSKNLKS